MVSNILDKAAIRLRLAHLRELEESARSAVLFAGNSTWILGDAIRSVLQDAQSLLDARESDSTAERVLSSLLGTLRADGYIVTPPAGDMPFDIDASPTDRPPSSRELDYGPDSGPPSSDAFPPSLLLLGVYVKIEGGPHDGHFARVADKRRDDMTYPVNLLGRAVEPVGAIPVPYDSLFVVGKDPDEAPTETKPDEERGRTEVEKLVSEWQPTKQQIAGYAKDLSVSDVRVGELLGTFRIAFDAGPSGPRKARWGGAFKDWAAKQVST